MPHSNDTICSRWCTGKRLPLTVFLLCFAFFALIMWCAPYSSDDLEFATLPYTRLSEYLRYVLEYGNGRLFGNACSILLSKVRVLCVLVKTAVMASTVVLLPGVLGMGSGMDYLLSFLLLTTTEPAIFGEAFVWTSGFSNYMTPIWMSLTILWLLRQYPKVSRLGKVGVCIITGLLGVVSQLCIEHSSGVNLLMALCALAFCLYKRDKVRALPSGIWMAATAVGLVLMLVVPGIFHIEDNHTDHYRSVQLGSVAAMVLSCAKNIIQLSNHHFGSCTLPMCLSGYAVLYLTRGSRSPKLEKLLYAANGISLIYLLLSLLLAQADYLGKGAIVQHIFSAVFALIPYAVWVVAALALEDPKLRGKLLTILAFALISLVPLLVVSPIPTRVVLQAHVFVMMGTLVCWEALRPVIPQGWEKSIFKGVLATALVLVLLLSSIFISIRSMSQIREAHIRRELEAGATEIVIFALPYEYTSWDHLWGQKFYNDTGRDVTFSSMSFTSWMNDIYR